MTQITKPLSPTFMPCIIVNDILEATAFYEKSFGFNTHTIVKNEAGVPNYAEMQHKDCLLSFTKTGTYSDTPPPKTSGHESPVRFYLYVDDVDMHFEHAVNHGATPITPPENQFWGDRLCRLKDHEGYVWAFASKIS